MIKVAVAAADIRRNLTKILYSNNHAFIRIWMLDISDMTNEEMLTAEMHLLRPVVG
jgi:hypothetical protein